MILYAERVSRWNSFSSKRKLNKQKMNNINNKQIQSKDQIILYVGTNNRYIMDFLWILWYLNGRVKGGSGTMKY